MEETPRTLEISFRLDGKRYAQKIVLTDDDEIIKDFLVRLEASIRKALKA